MCWKIKTPSVSTTVPTPAVAATNLVPQTEAQAPDSAQLGGSEDSFSQKKGRKQLTIDRRNSSFNPTNF
jgi:hypothetical protein